MALRFSIVTAFTLLAAAAAPAAEYTVNQQHKSFSATSLAIKVGDKVSFVNSDPFFHNVFSLSDTKTFDLGSYPKGQNRVVTFDNPGKVDVECAIHPTMKMTIEVRP